jgi:cystathionine gamma-lyase
VAAVPSFCHWLAALLLRQQLPAAAMAPLRGDGDGGFATAAVHAGQKPDPHSGAVMQPITLASTFQQRSPGVKYPAGHDYSRSGNPTRAALEACLAALEGAGCAPALEVQGLAFASGSVATVTVLHLLEEGDHVVVTDDVYGGTQRYFNQVAAHMGLSFSFVDFNREGAVAAAIAAHPRTRMLWIESPTNPLLKICDLRAAAALARAHSSTACRILTVVDNTFMSPFFQRPLELGADIVVESVSKYLNGHSDVIGGAVCTGDSALYTRLRFLQNAIGGVPSPFDCYLVLRGLKTLPLRMQQHAYNALTVARWLEGHPLVERVLYPGLPSHPQHELAQAQMHGFGGMITFFVRGGLAESRQMLENVQLVAMAESLGGVESLIEHPAIMTHASVPPERRQELGLSDNLLRLSVGVETVEDIVADLSRALDCVGASAVAAKAGPAEAEAALEAQIARLQSELATLRVGVSAAAL